MQKIIKAGNDTLMPGVCQISFDPFTQGSEPVALAMAVMLMALAMGRMVPAKMKIETVFIPVFVPKTLTRNWTAMTCVGLFNRVAMNIQIMDWTMTAMGKSMKRMFVDATWSAMVPPRQRKLRQLLIFALVI